jgi:ubiquinone/menaquinone biosynthesis C-methylase UbiE
MNNKDKILLEINKDAFRKNLSRFTWQAYNCLPNLLNPVILDVGCGSGIPTIELAILSKARIIAIDIDKNRLQRLKEKIKILRMEKQIRVQKASLARLPFKQGSFDIIWSEGSIAAIGFTKGLHAWYPYLKPGGFLVVHDDKLNFSIKIRAIEEHKYKLLKTIDIPEDIWRDEYFKLLAERLQLLHKKYEKLEKTREILYEEGYEVELFNRDPQKFASVFYIMQKV